MTNYAVSIDGLDEFIGEMNKLNDIAPLAVANTANFVAQSTALRAKNMIRTGGRSGRYYDLPGGGHTVSPPRS